MGFLSNLGNILTKERTLADVTSGKFFRGEVDTRSHLNQLQRDYAGTKQGLISKVRNHLLVGQADVSKLVTLEADELKGMNELMQTSESLINAERVHIHHLRNKHTEMGRFIERLIQTRIHQFREAEAHVRTLAQVAGAKRVAKNTVLLGGIVPAGIFGAAMMTGACTANTLVKAWEQMQKELGSGLQDALKRTAKGSLQVNEKVFKDPKYQDTIRQLDADLKQLHAEYIQSVKGTLTALGSTAIAPGVGGYQGVMGWVKMINQWMIKATMVEIALGTIKMSNNEAQTWIKLQTEELTIIENTLREHMQISDLIGHLLPVEMNYREFNIQESLKQIRKVIENREVA